MISSIKGMIGHTKAAAGVAGLIKAAMAVHHQVLPPAVGCVEPHQLLDEEEAALRVLRKAEPWPTGTAVRAGVTAMGFGGINTHIVLDQTDPARRVPFDTRTRALAASVQDVELLVVDGVTPAELRTRLELVLDFVPSLAYAQLADLAATLHRELRGGPYRAAVVVSSPDDAQRRLRGLCEALDAGETTLFTADGRGFLGHASGPGRIAFLFPGQGSGRGTSGGALRRRFAEVAEVYASAALPTSGDMVATSVAQPRIVTGSAAGLRALSMLGVEAAAAVGHSLGEISALHWAGALDEETLLRIASVRGRTMAEHSASGTMVGINESPEVVQPLLTDLPVVIAAYNGPQQTVVAGTEAALEDLGRRADAAGIGWRRLPVSHAFHSPLVAPAAEVFAGRLTEERVGPVGRRIVSTVTGEPLAPETDVPALLRRQITDPVLFTQAVTLVAKDIDLFVEVGPGRVLSGLAAATTDVPAVALDTDDESLAGLLAVVGAAYVVGAAPVHAGLFHGRLVRPLQVGAEFTFFESPCEAAPPLTLRSAVRRNPPAEAPASPDQPEHSGESIVDLLRRLAAERAELPLELVREESRLLDDLHLSSITVGQLVNQVAQQVAAGAPQGPTNFATATVRELADALAELAENTPDGDGGSSAVVAGAAAWSRAFRVDLDEAGPPRAASPRPAGAGGCTRPPTARSPSRCGTPWNAPTSAPGSWSACRRTVPSSTSNWPCSAPRRPPPVPPVAGSCWCNTAGARRGWRRHSGWRRRRCVPRSCTCRRRRPPSVTSWPRCAARPGSPRRTTTPPGTAGYRRCARCRSTRPGSSSRSTTGTCCWSAAAGRGSRPSVRWRWPPTPARRWRYSAGPTRPTTRNSRRT
ncbi:hypothetical protein GCM10027615_29360 [Plantactinospora veratri]